MAGVATAAGGAAHEAETPLGRLTLVLAFLCGLGPIAILVSFMVFRTDLGREEFLSTLAFVVGISILVLLLTSLAVARRLVWQMGRFASIVGEIDRAAWDGLVDAVIPAGGEGRDRVAAALCALVRSDRSDGSAIEWLVEAVRPAVRALDGSVEVDRTESGTDVRLRFPSQT